MRKTTILSGEDIADLLEGKKITVENVDFVFDGMHVSRIEQSLTQFIRRCEGENLENIPDKKTK